MYQLINQETDEVIGEFTEQMLLKIQTLFDEDDLSYEEEI